jgi:hypothetical protein
VFGVYPKALLDYMQPSVDQTVERLADWTKANVQATPPATANGDGEPAASTSVAARL